MNFLHSQYIARITGGRNKTQKKERKLWYDFQSRNISFENETRTKTKTTSTFDSIYEYFLCGQRNLESDARLASTRLDSQMEGRAKKRQKNGRRSQMGQNDECNAYANRTTLEPRGDFCTWRTRSPIDATFPSFFFFFFFILPAEIQTLEYVTNIYIYIYSYETRT